MTPSRTNNQRGQATNRVATNPHLCSPIPQSTRGSPERTPHARHRRGALHPHLQGPPARPGLGHTEVALRNTQGHLHDANLRPPLPQCHHPHTKVPLWRPHYQTNTHGGDCKTRRTTSPSPRCPCGLFRTTFPSPARLCASGTLESAQNVPPLPCVGRRPGVEDRVHRAQAAFDLASAPTVAHFAQRRLRLVRAVRRSPKPLGRLRRTRRTLAVGGRLGWNLENHPVEPSRDRNGPTHTRLVQKTVLQLSHGARQTSHQPSADPFRR